MEIRKNIGKNTLGDNSKMNVDLRTYNRSTHNLSHAWRSTMGVGTLVPCLKEVALPGDTWDIELDSKILTHPTVGPLFGSYKFQVDIFTCPMRLYMAPLHNNALNVGMDMAKVKMPLLNLGRKENGETQYSSSSILSYLGIKGVVKGVGNYAVNAVPLLSYIDIFKNYYANKQEELYYALTTDGTIYDMEFSTVSWKETGSTILTMAYVNRNYQYKPNYKYSIKNNVKTIPENEVEEYFDIVGETSGITIRLKEGKEYNWGTRDVHFQLILNGKGSIPSSFELNELDKLREYILSKGYTPVNLDDKNGGGSSYIKKILGKNLDGIWQAENPNSGLILKTHQSDLFNNWVKTEWVEQISEQSAVAVVSNSFTIDSLNLAKKVYDMLNRIAVSGGTYRDWMETVYTAEGYGHVETPVYEGGMSSEIEFQEVVSNSASGEQPLGTLGGRGINTTKKGGRLHIKVSEPSYIIAIASITPRVDYSQGYDWDVLGLKTMNDLHKPALDGIGFQDLTAKWMHFNTAENSAIGKQPAWIQYMTAVNKTFGNFAAGENESFMCLNRIYEANGINIINASTYINPEDYIYQFAERSLESQDFWVQIGFNIEARRVMSAKQIPNL